MEHTIEFGFFLLPYRSYPSVHYSYSLAGNPYMDWDSYPFLFSVILSISFYVNPLNEEFSWYSEIKFIHQLKALQPKCKKKQNFFKKKTSVDDCVGEIVELVFVEGMDLKSTRSQVLRYFWKGSFAPISWSMFSVWILVNRLSTSTLSNKNKIYLQR